MRHAFCHLQEMDGLDMVKQDHIFDLTGSENTDSKSSVAGGKYEIDKTVEYLIDSVRHLDIDDEAFLPIVIDMKRQILLIFKEAVNSLRSSRPQQAHFSVSASPPPPIAPMPVVAVTHSKADTEISFTHTH